MIYGNWVGVHKKFVKFLPLDRLYTEQEAMFSISVDIDNKQPGSVAGFAKLWQWSRNKVNRFLEEYCIEIIYPESVDKKQNQRGEIKGQIRDRSGTDKGQIRYIIDKALYGKKDRSGTDKGQMMDTTIDPNPEKKIIPQNEFAGDNQEEFYLTKKKRKLTGKRLETFNRFWSDFNYKKGKADAADSWLDIPQLTDALVNEICESAKREASARQGLIDQGRTPIYAQGWLTARRWEDEENTTHKLDIVV